MAGDKQVSRCSTSEVAQLIVTDPCVDTLPVGLPMTTQMSAARYLTDSISMTAEFGGNWPLRDSIDISATYSLPKTNKCGNILYQVIDTAGTVVDFVHFDGTGEVLILAPTLTSPATIGTHQLYIRATMDLYSSRSIKIPFTVTILECAPQIDSSLVRTTIDNYGYAWGANAMTLPTQAALAQYRYSPVGCDYSFTFDVAWLHPDNTLHNLPSVIKFNSS